MADMGWESSDGFVEEQHSNRSFKEEKSLRPIQFIRFKHFLFYLSQYEGFDWRYS